MDFFRCVTTKLFGWQWVNLDINGRVHCLRVRFSGGVCVVRAPNGMTLRLLDYGETSGGRRYYDTITWEPAHVCSLPEWLRPPEGKGD